MKTRLLSSFRNYILTRITKTFARCWYVSTAYGDIYGYTTHTRDLLLEGVTYYSYLGLQTSDSRTGEGISPGDVALTSFLSIADERLIIAGRFDNAYVEVFAVNYLDLTMQKIILNSGNIGEISRSDGSVTAEIRGISQTLQTKIGETFSTTCRANLGDERCGVILDNVEIALDVAIAGSPTNTITRSDGGSFIGDGFKVDSSITISGSTVGNNLTTTITTITNTVITVSASLTTESATLILIQPSPYYFSGSVTAVSDAKRSFSASFTPPNRLLNFGLITFLSGDNEGYTRDVSGQFENTITVFLDFPYDIQVGDTLEAYAGCRKDLATCITIFNNISNFRGEPYIPVLENVFSSPIVSPGTSSPV